MFPLLLLFSASLMHVHHHHGLLPKDHVRQLVLKAGSPPAWRITIPGLVKAIFFYPSLEYSLYVFFCQPLPHKEILFLPEKYSLTRTGWVFFRQIGTQVWPLQVVPHSCARCMAVSVQALPSLQHSPRRADSQQALQEAVSNVTSLDTSYVELSWRSSRAWDTPEVY